MHVTATLLCSGLKYPIHDTVICTKLTMMNFGQGNPIVYASSVTEERYLGYSFVMFRLESIYPVCFFFVQFIKVLQERGALLTKKIERGRQLLESEKARTAALEASVSDCISEEQYCEMRCRLARCVVVLAWFVRRPAIIRASPSWMLWRPVPARNYC